MPLKNANATLLPDVGMLALEYARNRGSLIGDQVLPIVRRGSRTGFYPVLDVQSLAKTADTRRAPRGRYARVDYEVNQDTFACVENGIEEVIDDSEANELSQWYDCIQQSADNCAWIALLSYEQRVADLVMDSSLYGDQTSTPATAWNASSSDPYGDVQTAKNAILANTGVRPNTIIMGRAARQALNTNAAIVDRIKYSDDVVSLGELPDSFLAAFFGVDRILVGQTYYDAAPLGQDVSMSTIWPEEDVLVCAINPSENLRTPTLGHTVLWTGDSPEMLVTETYRSDEVRSDVVRCRHHTDEKITLAQAGYLLTDAYVESSP